MRLWNNVVTIMFLMFINILFVINMDSIRELFNDANHTGVSSSYVDLIFNMIPVLLVVMIVAMAISIFMRGLTVGGHPTITYTESTVHPRVVETSNLRVKDEGKSTKDITIKDVKKSIKEGKMI